MATKEENTIGTLFLMILAFAAVIPGIILSGYVLTILWGWFVTPTFGIPVPSIPVMIGLSMIISYITYQNLHIEGDTRSPNTIFLTQIAYSFLRPLMTLGVGYIVHLYV